MQVVTNTNINEYPLLARGKVRDIYAVDANTLLLVTTDRMSAFDVIMNEPVPYKGVVLNQLTIFWMRQFNDILPNHLLETRVSNFPSGLQKYAEMLEGRSVLVRKASALPVECIVRGHISGSGWKDYKQSGSICGKRLPEGLMEASRLQEPLFTPSSKAELGQHDENISMEKVVQLVGPEIAKELEKKSLDIFDQGRRYAEERGILIADTKFEFGMIDGQLTLIDEVLTPDSSRFWPLEGYAPGKSQPSFDKQYLRDWLGTQQWDQSPPAPALPQDVVETTARKYMEAFTLITGLTLEASLEIY